MSRKIRDIEAEASESSRDMDIPEGVKPTRPGRATVLSVRLSQDEMGTLTRLAEERGVPVSTMARSLIIERLKGTGTDASVLHDAMVRAIRETVSPDVLAS